MVTLKLIQKEQDNDDQIIFLWKLPKLSNILEYKDIVKKLHELNNFKYKDYIIEWNYDHRMCQITNTQDLKLALKELYRYYIKNHCIRFHITPVLHFHEYGPPPPYEVYSS
ncbi:hypothetical protein MN116_007821 [Schistosoma mekongi]|uniref:Uncharacterized protein n=1 Tax=Schistosoma mekongi TaxID=38744 RepID=A0AAE1Z8B6_SCHME|nr:hypothetical protein MN116_007821 [Schistosoma mekongi]